MNNSESNDGNIEETENGGEVREAQGADSPAAAEVQTESAESIGDPAAEPNGNRPEETPKPTKAESVAPEKPLTIRPRPMASRDGKSSGGPNFMQKHFSKFLFLLIFCLITAGLILRRKIAYTQENERFMHDIAIVENAFFQYADGSSSANAAGPARAVANGNLRIEKQQTSDGREVTELVINAPHQSAEKMAELDRKIDDGNLATGRFTIRDRNVYAMRLLESKAKGLDSSRRKIKRPTSRMPANMDQLDENFLLK